MTKVDNGPGPAGAWSAASRERNVHPQPLKGNAMQGRSEEQERYTEEHVLVRQVTHIQASWAERERGKPGAFTLQLILDQGVDEYILKPSAEDAESLLRLFKMSNGAMFDRARKVLMFNDVTIT
jgi:hypothetical protein